MMPYRNIYGESCYCFGWLQADPGSDDFKPTTGGNTVWAKNKRKAISIVNKQQKKFEKENPNYVRLRVNVETVRILKSAEAHREYDFGLYLMTI